MRTSSSTARICFSISPCSEASYIKGKQIDCMQWLGSLVQATNLHSVFELSVLLNQELNDFIVFFGAHSFLFGSDQILQDLSEYRKMLFKIRSLQNVCSTYLQISSISSTTLNKVSLVDIFERFWASKAPQSWKILKLWSQVFPDWIVLESGVSWRRLVFRVATFAWWLKSSSFIREKLV